MVKKVIILVETPLQLMCAYEAMSNEIRPTKIYLRLTGRGRNDEQLINMAKILEIDFFVFSLETRKVILGLLRNSMFLIKLFFSGGSVVYVGSYFSKCLRFIKNIIRPDEVYFLDDGMATFLAQQKMKVSGDIESIFTFFNVMPLSGQKIIRHQFDNLMKKFPCQLIKGSYFIGQPLTAHGYVSEDEYINCVKKALEDAQDNQIIYIPHRVEEDAFVDKISQLSGVTVIYTKTCIELFFLKNGFGPEKIYGCSSTAFFSLAGMFPNCALHSYHIPNDKYNSIPHLEDIYNAMKKIPNIKMSTIGSSI